MMLCVCAAVLAALVISCGVLVKLTRPFFFFCTYPRPCSLALLSLAHGTSAVDCCCRRRLGRPAQRWPLRAPSGRGGRSSSRPSTGTSPPRTSLSRARASTSCNGCTGRAGRAHPPTPSPLPPPNRHRQSPRCRREARLAGRPSGACCTCGCAAVRPGLAPGPWCALPHPFTHPLFFVSVFGVARGASLLFSIRRLLVVCTIAVSFGGSGRCYNHLLSQRNCTPQCGQPPPAPPLTHWYSDCG